MTKEIPLTQGKVALVDDEDYPELSKFKWFAHNPSKNLWYAMRNAPRIMNKQDKIRMHRIILKPPKDMDTDHINGDGLDNRKENLRIVTTRENCQNKHSPKSSRYPGVTWRKDNKNWASRIQFKEKHYHLGDYSNEEKAAIRYKIACDWQVIEL